MQEVNFNLNLSDVMIVGLRNSIIFMVLRLKATEVIRYSYCDTLDL